MSNESNNQNARQPATALAVKLARESAFAHCNEHPYLPQTREQANSWQPHEWVVAAVHTAALIASLPVGHRFQADVADWMDQCFLPSLYSNMTERGDRLLEEVLELLQAHGYDSARVPTLVDYVFDRPVGEPAQEVGGVMVTLAAYCSVAGLSMQADGQAELDRINQPDVMARIRAKQEAKNALHFDTPLPGDATQPVPREAAYNAAGISLTACQLREALLMAGDPEPDFPFEDRSQIRIFWTDVGHSGPGLYCECVDAEEEGCMLLDGTAPAIRQPAQGLDLKQFRYLAEWVKSGCNFLHCDPAKLDRACSDLLAVIDSRELGND